LGRHFFINPISLPPAFKLLLPFHPAHDVFQSVELPHNFSITHFVSTHHQYTNNTFLLIQQ
jgi:hypothetical protein